MRRRLWIIAACVVAVAAWTGVQWVRSAYAVRHVEVRVTDAWCRDQSVDWSATGARIETSRAMRCQFQVVVGNDSGRDVHIDRVVAPGVGPHNGSVVRALAIATRSPRGDIDAVVDRDKDMWPHSGNAFTIVVVFNPRGCDDGGTVSFDHWPEVTVSSFGHRHTAYADFTPAFHNTIRTPGCRALEGQP